MDKPLIIDGKRVLEVYWRPELPEFLPAAWAASQLGWKRPPYPIGEGKTPEAAAADWSRLTGISLSEVDVQVTPR